MSEVSSRQALVSLVPRQVMLETATKAAATSKEDKCKMKKRNDKRVALVDVEDEEKKCKKKKSYKISDISEDVSGAQEDLAQHRPRGDGMSRNAMGRENLLRSIAAFLEGSGFSKTLSVFLLEAKIEVKSRGDSCVNLETLFDRVIESSQKDPIPSIEWPKEQGILLADAVDDSIVKAKDKKRKDKAASHSIEEENVVKKYLDSSLGTAENISYGNSLNVEKKKKRKVILGENNGEGHLNFEEVKEKIEKLKELTSNCSFETGQLEKNKSEKQKKKKEACQSLEHSELGVNREVIVEKPCDGGDYASTSHQESLILSGYNKVGDGCLNFEEVVEEKIIKLKEPTSNPSFEMSDIKKNKGEKKKKKKDANQSLERFELGVNTKNVILEKSSEGDFTYIKRQESLNSENIFKDLLGNVGGSKKNKKNDKAKKLEKSTSDSLPTTNSDIDGLGKNDNDVSGKSDFRNESIAISEENNGDVEKSTNKKRKRSSSNETSILVENIYAASKSELTKSDVVKVKKKTEDHKAFTCSEPSPLNGESKESFEGIILDKHEENPISAQKQLSEHQHANGNVEKHQNEGSTRTKSMKKEISSGKPKVVNTFQRIKVDDVQYADERLQDNSYWALNDSGSGYGAKAQEVLGQVRGRDFRHEKTKKKRGTYRGGQIDLQPHSFKFNYSDDE